MKILHIVNHVKKAGNGIVNVAVDLACLQAQEGHQVAIASAGGEYQSLLQEYSVEHFTLIQDRKPQIIVKAIAQTNKILTTFQPDIIHVHMITGVILAWMFKFKHQYTLIATVHNEFQKTAILMGLADQVIAVSEAVANALVKRGIPQAKISVVFNGTLDSPRTLCVNKYTPASLQHPAIVSVAGMYKRKGIDTLIAAFAQIAPEFLDIHLYLVGDGPDRSLFEEQAFNTNCSQRIHFEGFCSSPQTYLLATDIFVLASVHDPCPLALIEAREAGCAIIATAVDGIPEILEQGKAGILVPPQNPHLLAEALTRLLSDRQLKLEYARLAKENLPRYSAIRVNQETLSVYQNG